MIGALILIGFSGGVLVGIGFVAFLIVLDVVPRLAHIVNGGHRVAWLTFAVVLGACVGIIGEQHVFFIPGASHFLPVFFGLQGIFLGMVVAALTEVLNIFPIVMDKLALQRHRSVLVSALILGKMIGCVWAMRGM